MALLTYDLFFPEPSDAIKDVSSEKSLKPNNRHSAWWIRTNFLKLLFVLQGRGYFDISSLTRRVYKHTYIIGVWHN